MDGTILVADDDRTIRTVLTQALTRAGCRVRATGSAATLWKWIDEGEGNTVVSDVMMPDGNGLELLPEIHKRRPNLPVIVISAQNTVMTAIRASEVGAFDYLPKPFDLKELLSKVNKALLQSRATKPAIDQQAALGEGPLVGSSQPMQDVYRILARVVNTDLNVMIVGESGSGKNLIAKSLHDLSHRAQAPFVTLNLTSIPFAEAEIRVFGAANTPSMSEQARGGTLYLDEIGELSDGIQALLLRLLQEITETDCHIRVVSSTQKDLGALVGEGRFREDLFYRLNVVPLQLPALRDRPEDIPELARHFFEMGRDQGAPYHALSKTAIDALKNYSWPGNIRELENFLKQAAILCAEEDISGEFVKSILSRTPVHRGATEIGGEKLSASVEAHILRYFERHGGALPPPGLYNRILREVELPLITVSLAATRGNQIKTAELLGINRNTLRKKIKDLDIQVTRSKKMM